MKSRELPLAIGTGTRSECENQMVTVVLVDSCHIIPLGKDGKTISQSKVFGSV